MFAGFVLVVVATLYRLIPLFMGLGVTQPSWLPNFSPMAALCLCVAACFPRRLAVALPFAVLLGTDFLLNLHFSNVAIAAGRPPFPFLSIELLSKTLAFAIIGYFGWQLRRQARMKVLLPAAAGSSIFFYLVTNTASWLTEPGYAVTFSGWTQALFTGLPSYEPSWHFFRNAFVGDLLFTFLFLACIRVRPTVPETAKQPLAAW
jgi:hypothetical protein